MKTERLRVVNIAFDVKTVVKDEAFTKRNKLRRKVHGPVAALLRYEAHRWIDAVSPEDIIKNATITVEDVEVEELEQPPEQEKPDADSR